MVWFLAYLLVGAIVQCLILLERTIIRNVLVTSYNLEYDKEDWNVRTITIAMLVGFVVVCGNIVAWPVSIGFEIWLIKNEL